MTSFKRTQRKYVQKAYRVRNWREYETGLRARGSLTVWLGLTAGKLANWNSPRPTRRTPGRQRQYSNHAIETTVTLGLVFGLASRQTEGFLRSLLTLLNLDNDVPDHSTISRRKARLGKVASYERRTVKPVHLRIDSSGLSVHVGQLRTPPKARDYRKLHLAVDEQTSDVVACALTSKRARDASRVASLVGQIERPIASAKADAAYDTGDVEKTLENHRAHRSPKVLIPPRKGAQLALDSAGTRQRNRNIRARSRVGKRKWYVASGDSRRSKVETTFHRYKAILGSAMRARGLASQRVEVRLGCKILNTMDGARDTRWRDDRMTGRRSHGRLSALNGVVHQGTNARQAVADGFRAIKAAPFDGFPSLDSRQAEVDAATEIGIACIEAMRQAVGPDIALKIDVHSHFDVALAVAVARRLEPQQLSWYEEPVPPTDLVSTKAIKDGISQSMAGGEFLFGVEGFASLCRERAVDIIMPDVKHCGGLTELRKIATVAELHGVMVSPQVLLQGLGSRARIRWVDLVTRPIRTPCGSAASARPRRPSPSIAPVPCGAHA